MTIKPEAKHFFSKWYKRFKTTIILLSLLMNFYYSCVKIDIDDGVFYVTIYKPFNHNPNSLLYDFVVSTQ